MSALTIITTAPVRAGSPQPPVASVSASPEFGVIGSVVKLDGRGSTDPNGADLAFSWAFEQVPIGSFVMAEGFRAIEDDGGLVSFSPDKVGEYIIQLVVSNGTRSDTTSVKVGIRAILVPDGRGIVPDGKFIWSYIRDVWQGVENKEVFETFWSALLQLCGSELLKAYEVDFNKSIRDIQDLAQRRWLSYEPRLEIDSPNTSIIFGNQAAGVGATTEDLGQYAKAIVLGGNELIVVEGSVISSPQGRITVSYSRDQANVGKYELAGVNAAKTGYRLARPLPSPRGDFITPNPVVFTFGFQSTSWGVGEGGRQHSYGRLLTTQPAAIDQLSRTFAPKTEETGFDLRPGDVIHVLKGRNLGLYRITQVSGSFVTVDRAPPAASDSAPCNVYRPVGIQVTPPARAATSTFAVPYVPGKTDLSTLAAGRVMTVGTQAVTIVRSYIDTRQGVPVVVVATDEEDIIPDQVGLPWRVPHTLVSTTQDFSALGVSAGDLITFDVSLDGSNERVAVHGQVVGVDKGRLGFVVSIDSVQLGTVPTLDDQVLVDLASGFGITSAVFGYDGAFRISSTAAEMLEEMQSLSFQREYANKAHTPYDPITVGADRFLVSPHSIVRNHLIPVSDLLRSIPVLQEWVVQPQTVQKGDAWYQLREDQAYAIRGRPLLLSENQGFTIDGEVAYAGDLTFRVGSNVVSVQGASFFDKGLVSGDILRIEEPASLAGDYRISAVTGTDSLRLPVSLAGRGIVTAKVMVLRQRKGQFLRIVPGAFSAKNPLPDRLWAEVSYFDNYEAVEGNFGILVGLTKDDLAKVSTSLSYRQAVAGLMYAYTRGSAINKIRLGAQILLGLPYAEHRGVIRAIDPDYRLDASRIPILGRVLVEDVDNDGQPLGTLRAYTYPIDVTSTLAGLDVNPATKKLYDVGDLVELFAPLSKGVEVMDYLTNPGDAQSAKQVLQQFHSFRLRANDSVFTLDELTLVSNFLRRITPSAVAFVILSTTEFADQVRVTDAISFKLGFGGATQALEDNISLGLPLAMMWDLTTLSGREMLYWNGACRLLRSGRDLSVTEGVIAVASGTLVTSPTGHGTISKPGDRLVVSEGINKGVYEIATVTDSNITLVDSPYLSDGGPFAFTVLRKITSELRRGSYTATGDQVTVEDGLEVDLVMPGDLFVTSQGSKHLIISRADTGHLVVGLSPEGVEPAGSGSYRIYRPTLLESPLPDTGTLVSDGSTYTSFDNIYLQALADPTDEFLVQDELGARLFIADPWNLRVSPVLPAGSYQVSLCKEGRPPDPISFDHLNRNNPADWMELQVRNTNGSGQITVQKDDNTLALDLTLNPQVGDFVLIRSGEAKDLDLGYGAGRFPIVGRGSAGVYFALTWSKTEAVDWALCRSMSPRLRSYLQPPVAATPPAPEIILPTEGTIIDQDILS